MMSVGRLWPKLFSYGGEQTGHSRSPKCSNAKFHKGECTEVHKEIQKLGCWILVPIAIGTGLDFWNLYPRYLSSLATGVSVCSGSSSGISSQFSGSLL